MIYPDRLIRQTCRDLIAALVVHGCSDDSRLPDSLRKLLAKHDDMGPEVQGARITRYLLKVNGRGKLLPLLARMLNEGEELARTAFQVAYRLGAIEGASLAGRASENEASNADLLTLGAKVRELQELLDARNSELEILRRLAERHPEQVLAYVKEIQQNLDRKFREEVANRKQLSREVKAMIRAEDQRLGKSEREL